MQAELLGAIGAIAALPISIVAVLLSRRADDRSKLAARTQIYLTLRSRFIDVHSKLPANYADAGWVPSTPKEQGDAIRYWHHAFDEWYITTQLDPHLLADLWGNFFAPAIVSALRHYGLRWQLDFLITRRKEHDALWRDFGSRVDQLWRARHPGREPCEGLLCSHEHLPI